MKGTTIVMILASLWLVIFGILVLRGKAVEKVVLKHKDAIKDMEGYVKFNGIFYVTMGIVGVVLSIIDYVLKDNSVTTIAFIIFMFVAALIQGIMGKKYKKGTFED